MAFSHRSYVDYFVEPCDDHERSFRGNPRLEEQQRKRDIQFAIAQDLSRLASEEYRDDILIHMEEMEVSRTASPKQKWIVLTMQQLDTLPDVDSIEIQTEIQWFMRPYLLDFLIEAHAAFGLLPETLFLAVNLLDRYCSKRIVYKRHYQLVGCASLLIAAKYGDRKDRVPTIRELKNMCCHLYDEEMFTQMEWHVLQTLDWVVGHPTIDSFLQLALDGQTKDVEVENMARYIAEIAMFHKEFVSKLPSDMARSALALARYVFNRTQPHKLDWAAQYNPHTVMTLSHHLHRPSPVLAHKYSASHLSRAADLLEGFLARQISIARCFINLPSPLSDVASRDAAGTVDPQYGSSTVCVMPQKEQQFGFASNGSITPPITPTAPPEVAATYTCGLGDRRPPTPLSMYAQPAKRRRFNSTYHLPPLHCSSSTSIF